MIKTKQTDKKATTAFRKGWLHLDPQHQEAVKSAIMQVLEVTTYASFLNYKNGKREMKKSQATEVEAIFAKYDVLDIWGLY
ncbi:MAG: hypothetical protein IKO23_09865 [Bacteroidales bacterium]|nr:hypothetical protein [Bacteroidales bacterium]